VGQKKKKTKND